MAAARSGTWLSLRAVPWIVALIGLAVPLVRSGFALWPLVALWFAVLVVVWIVGRAAIPRERRLRIALAAAALPLLFLLGWEGGVWLIPATVAWLVVEVIEVVAPAS